MTEIMSNKKKLLKKIQNNSIISSKLQLEFRTIKVESAVIKSWSRRSSIEVDWECEENTKWENVWLCVDELEKEQELQEEMSGSLSPKMKMSE
jgi:hypothetical protein